MMIRSAIFKIRNNTCFLSSSSIRYMSVLNLSDKPAMEKFTAMNNKSVLYFTATWCPPCKMISPIYETLSKTHSEVGFGKVDVDDNAESAAEFKISAVPTFIFFNNDKVHATISGADQAKLEQLIEELKES